MRKQKKSLNALYILHNLDISKLRLNARIIVFLDINGRWLNEISVVISDYSALDDTWIEEEYVIGCEDPLYESFKAYFMKRLGEILFSV